MTFPSKLTVGSTFGVHPPRGGGQLRIFHLYREIAARCPVDVIALVAAGERRLERDIAPGLREIRVPKSPRHSEAEAELERDAGVPVTDVAFPELHHLTSGFADAVARSARPDGALVASHPYTLPALVSAAGDTPLWYDAHNVEGDLKEAMLRGSDTGRRLLSAARQVEEACCQRAALVLASCAEDAERLRALYGVSKENLALVQNGVDSRAIRFTGPAERLQLRALLRMDRAVALFIGSWHEPNLIAARRVFELARRLPGVDFAVVGSVGLAFRDVPIPDNVELFGIVDDGLKQSLLAIAGVALNPMSEGSGTNMKMLDYLAAGVPVVSTLVGARGLELDLVRDVRIARMDEFPEAVVAVLEESADAAAARIAEARRHVEERFDWSGVARRLLLRWEGSPSDYRAASSSATTA